MTHSQLFPRLRGALKDALEVADCLFLEHTTQLLQHARARGVDLRDGGLIPLGLSDEPAEPAACALNHLRKTSRKAQCRGVSQRDQGRT